MARKTTNMGMHDWNDGSDPWRREHWSKNINDIDNEFGQRGFNAVWAGGDPTGTQDSTNAIKAGFLASNEVFFPPNSVFLITEDLEISKGQTLNFAPGARIRPAFGVRLIKNGRIKASPYDEIFDLSLGGIIAGDPEVGKVYPKWFGTTDLSKFPNWIPTKYARVELMDYKHFATEVDGVVTDWHDAIQSAMDSVNSKIDSAFNVFADPMPRGKVVIPPGDFPTRNIDAMKSNVHIEGAGRFVTRIRPLSSSGYVFDVKGVNTGNRIANVGISRLTIGPSDNIFGNDVVKPTVGGINLSYTTQISLSEIGIYNLAGIGINQVENFDAYFHDITLLMLDTAVTYMNGTNDTTNAVHWTDGRIEMCSVAVLIENNGTFLLSRQNQITNVKIESPNGSKIVNSQIIVRGCAHFKFIGCGFVPKGDTYPFVKADGVGGEIRGLQFVGIDIITPTPGQGWFLDSQSLVNEISIIGGSASGLKKLATGSNVNIIGFTASELSAGFIDLNYSTVTGCVFKSFTDSSDYAIKLRTRSLFSGNKIYGFSTKTAKGVYVGDGQNRVKDNLLEGLDIALYIDGGGNIIGDNIFNSVNVEITGVYGWQNNNTVRDARNRIQQFITLPTADVKNEGRMIWIPGGAGVADKVYICLKSASDTYSWVQIAMG